MLPEVFLACARSYADCNASQASAVPPNALSSRIAISGEIPALPLTKIVQDLAGYSEYVRALGYRKSERHETVMTHRESGVRRFLHRHGPPPERLPENGSQ
jgi:hypothetical protein